MQNVLSSSSKEFEFSEMISTLFELISSFDVGKKLENFCSIRLNLSEFIANVKNHCREWIEENLFEFRREISIAAENLKVRFGRFEENLLEKIENFGQMKKLFQNLDEFDRDKFFLENQIEKFRFAEKIFRNFDFRFDEENLWARFDALRRRVVQRRANFPNLTKRFGEVFQIRREIFSRRLEILRENFRRISQEKNDFRRIEIILEPFYRQFEQVEREYHDFNEEIRIFQHQNFSFANFNETKRFVDFLRGVQLFFDDFRRKQETFRASSLQNLDFEQLFRFIEQNQTTLRNFTEIHPDNGFLKNIDDFIQGKTDAGLKRKSFHDDRFCQRRKSSRCFQFHGFTYTNRKSYETR